MESQNNSLLNKIRHNFGFFGGLSFIFGAVGTLLFYKAGTGLNSFIFTIIIVALLMLISKRLNVPITNEVVFCFTGSVLLGLSNILTSSIDLRFLNNVGILLLLDFSLNRLFNEDKRTGFLDNLFDLVKLPFKAICSVRMFFIDGNSFVKDKKIIRNDRFRSILIGCLIAIPLLVVIIALLSKADLMFGKFTDTMFDWIISSEIFIIIIAIITGTLLCYSLLCGSAKEKNADPRKEFKASPIIGITVSAILLLTYIIFCGIQMLYLFAGGIYVLPEEFTYAEYARQGFFELLAVTCLNIILILVCVKVFEENKLLRAILTAITACTYIMIASAAYRMVLYIGAYHLTLLRLFVLLFLLIDALILAGIIISLYSKNFPLFEYSVVVVTVCYLAFSFSRPDYHIARYFVDHTDKIASEDMNYLTEVLSYDAASVVVPLLEKQDDYVLRDYINLYCSRYSKYDSGDIREFNYSYKKAGKLIKDHLSNLN